MSASSLYVARVEFPPKLPDPPLLAGSGVPKIRRKRRVSRPGKPTLAHRTKKKPARPSFPPLPADTPMVQYPRAWLSAAVRAQMLKMVKPPTATTRRIEKHLKMEVPIEALEDLMAPFEEEEVEGLKWEELPCGSRRLMPTRSSATNHFYNFSVTKGKLQDKLWALDQQETQKSKKEAAWRRGLGAARLHLSRAASLRGELTVLLSLMCGKVDMVMKQPRDHRAMPTLRLKAKSLTMDHLGNIILPCEFNDNNYKAALRKQALVILKKMIDDPLYPTSISPTQDFNLALTNRAGTSTTHSAAITESSLLAPPPLALALCG